MTLMSMKNINTYILYWDTNTSNTVFDQSNCVIFFKFQAVSIVAALSLCTRKKDGADLKGAAKA